MCGRYVSIEEEELMEFRKIVDEVSKKISENEIKYGEVFPTNDVVVLYSHRNKRVLSSAKWGFPNYKGGVVINARSESVDEKPMFRNSFITRRCVMPAAGYYEWLTDGKTKTKYQIGINDKKIIYLAGLYNIFVDKEGQKYPATTIITTTPHPDIEFIHNRMPVILSDNNVEKWLDNSITDLGELQNLLIPYSESEIIYKAV